MFIAVSGNIGAGKSTLVKKLAQCYGCRAVLETVTDNPYLNDFYEDMARWAFPLQIYFLNHRFRQGLSIAQSSEGVILDRTINEDAEIFARNLYQLGYLSPRDYDNYRGIYASMRSLLPTPDLIIYLKGSVEILQGRIVERVAQAPLSRKNEGTIPGEYLEQLNRRYDEWITNFASAPIITVDIDTVDLAQTEAFNGLTERINEVLGIAR